MHLPFFITREGIAYLFVLAFVLAVAILRDINLLYVVAGLMIGPLVINGVIAALVPRGVVVKRYLPEALEAGDELIAHLSLANPRQRLAAWLVVVTDTLERHRAPLRQRRVTASAWFPHVPAGATRHTTYRGRLIERGRYRFGPLRLSCRFPLGLLRRTVTIDAPDYLVVYPRLATLTEKARALWRQTARGERSARRRGRGEAEFHGLRDWQRGDSRRWIHWRSSARRGEIVVREFEHQEHHDLAILLDLAATGNITRRQIEITERAVSIAATFAAQACVEPAARVVLAIAADREIVLSGSSSTSLRGEMLAALAEVEAHAITSADDARIHEGRLRAAVDEITRFSRSDTPVIVVSTRSRTEIADQAASTSLGKLPNSWVVISAVEADNQYVVFEQRVWPTPKHQTTEQSNR